MKLNEFKPFIISELFENRKVLTRSGFQNILQKYNNLLEEVSLTIAIFSSTWQAWNRNIRIFKKKIGKIDTI